MLEFPGISITPLIHQSILNDLAADSRIHECFRTDGGC